MTGSFLSLLSGPSVATREILDFLEEPSKRELTSTETATQRLVYQVLASRVIDDGTVQRVMFLDIDGVLVRLTEHEQSHHKAKNARQSYPSLTQSEITWNFVIEDFVQEAVTNLKRILDASRNTAIVITSKRRNNSSVVHMRKATEEAFGNYIIDKTQDTIIPKISRGQEITIWNDAHPSVKNYVILDDDDEFISYTPTALTTPLADHFVQVQGEYLTKTEADKAISVLNTLV